MKTSRIDKLEVELNAEEMKLRQHLLRILPGAAESGTNVFSNSAFNPSNLQPRHSRSDAETLLASARECVRIRQEIGLDVTGSVGALFPRQTGESPAHFAQSAGPPSTRELHRQGSRSDMAAGRA
ncbi:MAG TPA: hypothetical protein PKE27_10475 [Povalibacter sp.]|uniref:hypothetical protein n=1 Tax=Povalibacter sp. TaxID=1962978 RepID=UPI002D063B09|nr:hypothetical protein [Povalibacter sp.]HMN44991.1 hypothetical protein [Povalibacter sp.]